MAIFSDMNPGVCVLLDPLTLILIVDIYVSVYKFSFKICQLKIYIIRLIVLPWEQFLWIHLCKWQKQHYIGPYCKNSMYCNYSTTSLNTTILQVLVHLVHIYFACTYGCHTSLSTDFSVGGVGLQMDPYPSALIHGHIATYHNAHICSQVNMATICWPTATKNEGFISIIIKELE